MKNSERRRVCTLPENKHLSLRPCPICDALTVEESGDNFKGIVTCSNCGQKTPTCNGTKAAIELWNNRNKIEDWI